MVNAAFNYATALQVADRAEEADVLYPEIIAQKRAVFGPAHEATLIALNNHALLARQLGKQDQAIERIRAVVAAHEQRPQAATPDYLKALTSLGAMLVEIRQHGEAEPILATAATLSREMLADDDIYGMQIRFNYGCCLAAVKKWAEAEPLLLEAHQGLSAALPREHPVLGAVLRSIAVCYEHNGFPEEAARWREK